MLCTSEMATSAAPSHCKSELGKLPGFVSLTSFTHFCSFFFFLTILFFSPFLSDFFFPFYCGMDDEVSGPAKERAFLDGPSA